MSIKKSLLALAFVALSYTGLAQQESLYTQYMYNPSVFNPGYTGSRATASFNLNHRSQWVGLEGAPTTTQFSYQMPISKYNLGLGVHFSNDALGNISEQNIAIDVAYHLQVNDIAKLSLGIKASSNLLNVDFNQLNLFQTDTSLNQNIDRQFSPNLGVGLFYYTDKLYVGFSAPNLFKSNHFDDPQVQQNTANYLVTDQIHYYATAGYVLPLNDRLLFKPSSMVRFVSGTEAQVDVSANFMYDATFTFGASYRVGNAISALVGAEVTKGLFIGYAYDKENTLLQNTNNGSHEVFLRYDLFSRKGNKNVQLPRFF